MKLANLYMCEPIIFFIFTLFKKVPFKRVYPNGADLKQLEKVVSPTFL